MPPRGANLRWRGRTRLELVDMSNDTPLHDILSNRLGGPHKLSDLMPLVLAQIPQDTDDEAEAPAGDDE